MSTRSGESHAERIVHGMQSAIRSGNVTCDLARRMNAEGREDVHELSCSGFGQAIIELM